MRKIIGNVIVYFLLQNSKFTELWKKIMFDLLSEPGTANMKCFAERLSYAISSPTMKQMADLQKEVKVLKDKLTPEKIVNERDHNLFLFEKKNLTMRFQKNDKDYGYFHVSIPIEVETYCSTKDFYYGDYGSSELNEATLAIIRPFLEAIYNTKMVAKVNIDNFKIHITKVATSSWEEVRQPIMDAIASCFPDIEPEIFDEEKIVIQAS